MEIDYIGWNGNSNYGDDIGQKIIDKMGFKPNKDTQIGLIGVGTLFPLSFIQENFEKELKKELIVFGTGCEDRNFVINNVWKHKVDDADLFLTKQSYDKQLKITQNLLKQSKFVGVRDEFTRKTLGFGECIGDPFYSLHIPPKQEQKEPYVIVNIGRGGFNVWGGIDAEFDTLKNVIKFTKNFLIQKLRLKVLILSLSKNDGFIADTVARYLGCKHISPKDFKEILTFINNAEFIITYKLHALITALTTNTPVIGIEYRPKIGHTAIDFKIEKHILKTNEVTEETLEKKYYMLKEWNSDFITTKKKEYADKQHHFIEQVKKYYGKKY